MTRLRWAARIIGLILLGLLLFISLAALALWLFLPAPPPGCVQFLPCPD